MSETWKRLIDLAQASVVPNAVREWVPSQADVDSPDFDVKRGQIWLARWRNESLTVLTLAGADAARTVLAAPVTIEPELEDEDSVVLDAGVNPFDTAATIWFGLARQIPVFTFVHPISSVSEHVLYGAERLAVSSAAETQSTGMRRGHAYHFNESPSAAQRAELDDLLETWISDMRPLAVSSTSKASSARRKPPFTFLQVMAALDVRQPQAMDIVRGKHHLATGEAERLAQHVGCTVEEILSTVEPLPEEALVELEQPRWRHLVRSEAAEQGINEPAARVRIGYQALALAARQHGAGEQVWKQRLRTIALSRYSAEQ
jgi:hypothetical protein